LPGQLIARFDDAMSAPFARSTQLAPRLVAPRRASQCVEGVADGPIAGLTTRVTVLAGIAEIVDTIDVARAEAARAAALARLDQLRAGGARDETSSEADVEIGQLESAVARADTRLKLAGTPAGS